MLPLVSVIIPVYNTRNYLRRCLDSLKKQTFKNWEALCINDSSTDCSWEILQEYAAGDTRIRIYNQANAGPGAARQNGLNHAKGKYIMFLDSDDWYDEDMLSEMIAAMENHDIDLACCQTEVEDEKGLTCRTADELRFYYNKQSGLLLFNAKSRLETNGIIWNKIYKKDIIDRFNISFATTFEGEDTIFSYCYKCMSRNIFFIDKKLYHYFRNQKSLMSQMKCQKNQRLDNQIHNTEHLLAFLRKNDFLAKDINTHLELIRGNITFCFSHLDKHLWPEIIRPLAAVLRQYGITEQKMPQLTVDNRQWLHTVSVCNTDYLITITKRIKVGRLTLFKIKTKTQQIKFYFLGIPIWHRKNKMLL